MSGNSNHCSFVLLAEFDIFEGAALKYQFPQPLGIDEGLLAMSMLPDGADTQLDDWTIFFLNQTPFNTISPVLALETPEIDGRERRSVEIDADKPELLCVLNLVRTKHDKSEDRGAKVRAMAICTRHPFIQIFKPVLLMAMDHYFSEPSQDCLARLFDSVNAMDLSNAPVLTRQEKIVMRSSERKDIFIEKFTHAKPSDTYFSNVSRGNSTLGVIRHRPTHSGESYSSFEEGILMRNRERERDNQEAKDQARRERAATESMAGMSLQNSHNHSYSQNHSQYQNQNSSQNLAQTQSQNQNPSQNQAQAQAQAQAHSHNFGQPSPPSDSSFSLGGSAVWVGDESGLETFGGGSTTSLVGSSTVVSSRGRRSTDASSGSSNGPHGKEHSRGPAPVMTPSWDSQMRVGGIKDTHFYETVIAYKDHQIPIKMPLSTFPEEVGDYSLIPLVKTFHSYQLVSGPLHPHLHTNGPQTHPIIILFNALVTGKRIIFMGYKRPAGQVSSFVMSACALGSGCGAVLRGLIERAFPYANLKNKDEWESVPGYIAGVTNLIFQTSGVWDVLFDIASGQVIVSKDILSTCPPTPGPGFGGQPLILRSGTLKAELSIGSDPGRDPKDSSQKPDFVPKGDNPDNLFIEDIRSAIEYHFGETMVRMRFTEYAIRFVRLAARYEAEVMGTTKIGFPSALFSEGPPGGRPQLGSGIVFSDDTTALKELGANANRIEGWRRTNTYQYCVQDFAKAQATNSIKGFDVLHQLFRLRHARNMPDAEVELIMQTIADSVQSYEQVIELLAYLTPNGGGLMHLSFGLFHQQESVREATVEIFNQLRAYPVGVSFLQALNHFQRYAYVRQAHAREKRGTQHDKQHQYYYPPPTVTARTFSNRSDSSMPNGAF